MRKIFSSIMLVAVAAMAFVSCQKEETSAPETVSATLTLNANVEQTKTYLGEDNQVLWGKGEAVTLYVGSGETAKFFDSASTDYDGVASASFTFEIKDVTEADSYALGGIYPASASLDDNDDPKKCKTILPQIQNAESGKYDPSAYIMVLKPETVGTLPTEYKASFRRATALNKITLTNVKEDITTVEITVPKEQVLAGRRNFDLTNGTSGEIYYGQSNTITVNSQFTGNSIDVWFCSWGVELAAGEEMTIRMKNANKSFTRTIVAKEAGIKFVEGDLNTLKIDMASAEEESFDSFAGEWLITGTTGGVTYAAGAYVNGKNNLNNNVPITISNDVIEPIDGIENCKMLFTKVTEGDYEGMYTIQDANGNYLYAAASGSNHLKATAAANSAHYYWVVEFNDGKYSVVASKSSNRNVMQFNPNNGSPIFSCYASASQVAVVLYPYSMVKVDTTPKIVVSGETTKDVVFGGETVTFNYELKYLDGEELSWEVSDSDMITSVSAENGVLTVTVAENDGDARTATITLSCGDAEEVELKINQAEYVDTSVIEKITVAEFLNKSVDATVWYELTGRIKEIKNPNYGNFYLEDETGYVYVYGLTAEKVDKNDQSFVDLDLKLGDIVTLIGTRAQYAAASVADQKEQVGGPAYYVSHVAAPTLEVSPANITIEADVTTAEFELSCDRGYDITYPEGVVEVSEVHSNETGSSTYTVEFPANETTDPIIYVITVKADAEGFDVEKTVTITQKAASLGGGDEPVIPSTYQYIFKAKPGTGSVTLGDVKWTISATNLNNYNSSNYAGVQFGTSSKTGKITLTSQDPFTYDGKSTVKEIRLWLNNGSGTITPTVTINGVKCTMTGTITKNSSAGSDYKKASLVTFTPAQPTSGVVVIDLSCNKAGYFCAMEIDVQ